MIFKIFLFVISDKIEPKLSTILCYQSPRKNKKKITSLKDTMYNRNIAISEKRKLYKPSSRYYDKKLTSMNDNCSLKKEFKESFFNFYLQKITNFKINKKLKYNCEKTKCDNFKIINSFNNKADDYIDVMINNNKILRLMGSSPRSLYVRKNIKILKTYSKSTERECKQINRMKIPVLAQINNISFRKNKKKYIKDDIENIEHIFDIVTNDGKKFKLNPMKLNDSNWILSYLENYLGLNK